MLYDAEYYINMMMVEYLKWYEVFMIYLLLQTPFSSLHFTTIIFVEEHNSPTCP